MKFIKRIAAGVLALAVSASLFGCGEGTKWAAKSGDITIPAGVFIYYEMSSYYEALTLLKESDDTATVVTKDDTVEDKPALDWIQDKSIDKMRQYVAIERKFDELKLTLTEEETTGVDNMVSTYMSYYAENYADNGISEDSLRKAFIADAKYSAIFKRYYVDEDGISPVPESDVKEFYKNEFARAKILEVKLKDGKGELLKGDDKTKEIKLAEDYLKRAKDGEDFDGLIKEYTDYYDALVAAAETTAETPAGAADPEPEETTTPEDETTTEDEETTTAPGETTTEGETTTTAPYANEVFVHNVDGKSDKTYFSDKDNNYIYVKNTDTYSEKVIKDIFNGRNDTPFLVEDDESYYIVLKSDILALTSIYDSEYENLIWEMKDEDFKAIVKGFSDSVALDENKKAYKRYNPFELTI